MSEFQPLLLENLKLSLPQVQVRRICVNRHLPETNWVRSHAHDFEQLIVYLSGAGAQRVGERRIAVASGAVIAVPRKVKHAFVRDSERVRLPMCLVIDLKISARSVAARLQAVTQLSASRTAEIRRALLALAREVESADPNPLRQGAAILEISGLVLETAAGLRQQRGQTAKGYEEKIGRLLAKRDLAEWTPAGIAEGLGVQRDVLNRSLKQECGLTVGGLLAARRLDAAKALLRNTDDEIQDIAATVGFVDRNYFSRWFRRQSGLSPGEWRRHEA